MPAKPEEGMHLTCNLRPQHRPGCSASEVLESVDHGGAGLLIKRKLSQFNSVIDDVNFVSENSFKHLFHDELFRA